VSELGIAYIQGMQTLPTNYDPVLDQDLFLLATPKHYLGDGGTTFGSSTQVIEKQYLLDQGDMRFNETEIRAMFLPPYQAAVVEAGAMSVMVSFSSWNGTKMHAQRYWITDVLKGELGFKGFVISDWGGMDQIDSDYYTSIVAGINAGIDMNMVPYDYIRFIDTMKIAFQNGDISGVRIDDAVRRILTVKIKLGLFDHPYAEPTLIGTIGSDTHRTLARQAVRESLVLLKNNTATLPLAKDSGLIYVAGQGAMIWVCSAEVGPLIGRGNLETSSQERPSSREFVRRSQITRRLNTTSAVSLMKSLKLVSWWLASTLMLKALEIQGT
jgi:beta-glucosidase